MKWPLDYLFKMAWVGNLNSDLMRWPYSGRLLQPDDALYSPGHPSSGGGRNGSMCHMDPCEVMEPYTDLGIHPQEVTLKD